MHHHTRERGDSTGACDYGDTQFSPQAMRPQERQSASHGLRRHKNKRRLIVPLLLQIGAMIGIGALLYPSAADWFATLNHNAEVSGYVREVEALPSADREAKLEIAREYNSFMPQGVLRDPYAPAAADETLTADSAYKAYEQVLSVSNNGVIGELSYPNIDINLPVYHGTSESVISKGVGHLYGSSLPIGGPSTHSVLTSHSGLIHAALFTPLTKAKIGDHFTVTVLGEKHYYRVDQIDTVLPEDTERLRVVNGEDYVTLITCTPIGVNSHRLLVRGVRTAAPLEKSASSLIAGDGKIAGFPWWAVTFLGGSAFVAYLLFSPPKRNVLPRDRQDQNYQIKDVPA